MKLDMNLCSLFYLKCLLEWCQLKEGEYQSKSDASVHYQK